MIIFDCLRRAEGGEMSVFLVAGKLVLFRLPCVVGELGSGLSCFR